jgi:hypothetical protein
LQASGELSKTFFTYELQLASQIMQLHGAECALSAIRSTPFMKQPDQATAHDRCCICFHDMALRLMQYPTSAKQISRQRHKVKANRQAGSSFQAAFCSKASV